MGPISSHPCLSDIANTLQNALPHRSDRRVKPAPDIQSKLFADTPVLTARRAGKHHRRFRTSERNQKRSYESEDDDCACVFGKSRAASTQSLPSVIPVRRFRPVYPSPLPPSSEYRLFIENIELDGRIIESTYEEQDVETGRFESERLFTSVICPCGKPRPTLSPVSKPESRPERGEPIVQQESVPESVPEPQPAPETKPDEKASSEETPPCVCALPSKKPCPCDKRLFEAMKPWSKIKLAFLALLVLALAAWLLVFFFAL